MRSISEAGKRKKLELYGEDQAPQFSDKLEKFRDDMLAKIENEETKDDDNLLQEAYDEQDGFAPPPRRTMIHEIEDDESVNENEVPPLEEKAPLIQEIDGELNVNVHSMDIVMPQDSPNALHCDRKLSALATIEEEGEPNSGSEAKYVTPMDQRRADLSLLDEIAIQRQERLEDMSEPLLAGSSEVYVKPSIKVTSAWEVPVKEAKKPVIVEEEIEEISTEGFSKQSTLVELDGPKQAWGK
jgi:hypothetical protein